MEVTKAKKIAKVENKNKDYHILVFGVCACRLKGHHSDTIFYFNLTPDISPIGCLILVNTEQKEQYPEFQLDFVNTSEVSELN